MGISFQGPTRKPQTPGAVGQIPPQGRGLREREEIRDQDELSCNAVFGKPIGKLWPLRQPPGCVCQRSSVDRTPCIISVRGPPESHPREGTLPWAPPLQGPSPSLGSCRGAGGSPRTESHLFATWQQPGEPREGASASQRPGLAPARHRAACVPGSAGAGDGCYSHIRPPTRETSTWQRQDRHSSASAPSSAPAGRAELSISSLPGEPGGQSGRGGQRRGRASPGCRATAKETDSLCKGHCARGPTPDPPPWASGVGPPRQPTTSPPPSDLGLLGCWCRFSGETSPT